MASMRDIKRRKGSIQSTQQITKAMKLVATVKLQKARTRAEQTTTYTNRMYQTVSSILAKSGNIKHPYLVSGESTKKAVVAITSNRGLAGGYNSNIIKLIANSDLPREEVEIYAIGNKGLEAFVRKGYSIKYSDAKLVESPSYADAAALCREVLKGYTDGEMGEIYLAYTHFKNTVVQEPVLIKLLPVENDTAEAGQSDGAKAQMTYEPNEDAVLDLIIPKYVTSLFYGALVEAVASENSARMQAMDSATSNAEEIIGDLTLKYNRARQGAITQELTEIIGGASAIS